MITIEIGMKVIICGQNNYDSKKNKCVLLAHLSRSDKVSFCDRSSPMVRRPSVNN